MEKSCKDYLKDGDFDAVIASSSKEIAGNKENKEEKIKAYLDRARAYCIKGEWDKAIADCASALVENAGMEIEAKKLWALAYLGKGELSAILNKDGLPSISDPSELAGFICYSKGKNDEALEYFRKALIGHFDQLADHPLLLWKYREVKNSVDAN